MLLYMAAGACGALRANFSTMICPNSTTPSQDVLLRCSMPLLRSSGSSSRIKPNEKWALKATPLGPAQHTEPMAPVCSGQGPPVRPHPDAVRAAAAARNRGRGGEATCRNAGSKV